MELISRDATTFPLLQTLIAGRKWRRPAQSAPRHCCALKSLGYTNKNKHSSERRQPISRGLSSSQSRDSKRVNVLGDPSRGRRGALVQARGAARLVREWARCVLWNWPWRLTEIPQGLGTPQSGRVCVYALPPLRRSETRSGNALPEACSHRQHRSVIAISIIGSCNVARG